ncbi:hypothetical protein FANTH_12975 [Fusarium anthophilum]|uniref:Uncharacterized protein n=1 Tax=Fusarium anthophilum TaxID=48485 RepID=A0A8H5DR49_9HYPO|nr:hypothetical protein FANTH_12975 [Fusarium anthophilum]
MIRLGWLSWAFACLPGLIVSTSPTYLEQSIQDLNITDPEEVKLFKLLLNDAVPKPMDGAVLTTGLVAGQTLECCDEDQKCDNDAQTCINPTATVTETTTSWATETDTETVTTDGTTTVRTVSTIETTISVTVSRGPTGDEPTGENTATDSDRKYKRFVPAATHEHLGSDAPVTTTIPPIVLRPAASLNELADGLARRGIPIHRRATDRETVYKTKKATTTITVKPGL